MALELPESVQAELATLQRELQKSGADAKWVEPHNLHITLKFLGSVNTEKIPPIISALDNLLKNETALTMTLEGLGGFPSKTAPRVVWAGFREEAPRLKTLAQAIENTLSGLGFQKETRPFETHATLARLRSSRNRVALAEKIELSQKTLTGETFTADRLTLFESQLSSQGPTYRCVHRIILR